MPLRTRITARVVLAVAVLWGVFAIAAGGRGPGEAVSRTLGIGLALLAVLALGLHACLRRLLQPLERSVHTLTCLAQGDLRVDPCGPDLALDHEAGQIARGVAAVYHELAHLRGLRNELARTHHARLAHMREQLRLLAGILDEAPRADILAALDAMALQGVAGQVDDAVDAVDAEMSGLSRILGHIAGLLHQRQDRLVGVLHELRQALEHQAALAGLRQELEIARNMQQSILPRGLPQLRGVEVTALMVPAREVGGDFYDYFMVDHDHVAVAIADVSGKGIPAAFFMAISRTLLKSNALFLREPGQVLERLNEQLCAENEHMMFVTVFLAVLDVRTGTLDFVNAGHTPPAVRDKEAGVRLLPRGQNAALAVIHDLRLRPGRIRLSPGDTLLLYTDGMTEANNPHGVQFGEGRLLDALRLHDPACEDLPQALLRRVREFEAGSAQADDITCVAVRYLPP